MVHLAMVNCPIYISLLAIIIAVTYLLHTHYNFSSDVDECVEAALERRMTCPHSAYCVNNPGGYECICPGDTQLIDGECIQRT